MKKQSILEQVFTDVNNIEWSSNKVNQKAINFITTQFNRFINDYGTLMNYIPMSNEYWSKCITGKTDHLREVKTKLVSHNILEVKSGIYNKDKRVLAYKLNTKYIINNNNKFTISLLADPFSNTLKNNELQTLIEYTKNNLKSLTIEKGSASNEKGSALNECIYNISRIHKKGSASNEKGSVLINEEIETEFITLFKNYRYTLESALELAKSMNVDLIEYKGKHYLHNADEFIQYKQKELEMLYYRQIFNIENNIVYANRNETNHRLDHNLTGLKKELFKFIRFENEELKEIDIVNAQFVIACYVNTNIDIKFKELAQTGKLYEFIGEELNINRKEAKELMFRIAFDKVKKTDNFNKLRELFPLFMEWVDNYKKENGYKMFSNLLQKTESKIMIDGVLNHLYNLGYNVFTVHDSVRCKESDYTNILNEIQSYFNDILFVCSLNTKDNVTIKEDNKVQENECMIKKIKLSDLVINFTQEQLFEDLKRRLEKINEKCLLNVLDVRFEKDRFVYVEDLYNVLKEQNDSRVYMSSKNRKIIKIEKIS